MYFSPLLTLCPLFAMTTRILPGDPEAYLHEPDLSVAAIQSISGNISTNGTVQIRLLAL